MKLKIIVIKYNMSKLLLFRKYFNKYSVKIYEISYIKYSVVLKLSGDEKYENIYTNNWLSNYNITDNNLSFMCYLFTISNIEVLDYNNDSKIIQFKNTKFDDVELVLEKMPLFENISTPKDKNINIFKTNDSINISISDKNLKLSLDDILDRVYPFIFTIDEFYDILEKNKLSIINDKFILHYIVEGIDINIDLSSKYNYC